MSEHVRRSRRSYEGMFEMGLKKKVKVIILTQDNEMEVASCVFQIGYFVKVELEQEPNILVIDNNSSDRTLHLALSSGVKVLRFNNRSPKKDIVEKALSFGKKERMNTLIILDLTGGNDAEDGISLIKKSQEEGSRFASAYIHPPKGDGAVGCWAIDRGLLNVMNGDGVYKVEDKLFELASEEDLEMLAIRERSGRKRKKQKTSLFKGIPTDPFKAMTALVRYHPLSFYGSLGATSLFGAVLSGVATLQYFYKHNELSYFPAFVTVTLVMIGGFLFVAGLILNAFNVLVEKIEAIRRWVD